MPNTEKTEKVAALKERIEGSNALLLAEYRGLTVHDATELRRSLSEEARFSVAKNTLLRRAASDAGVEGLDELLQGPTAVAFVQGDVVATAKKLVDAAKKFPALVLKGAYMEGKVLSADQAKALADLESREVMLSKIAGLMKSEMTRAAGMLQAVQSRFVGLLEALKDKLPAVEPAAEAEAEEPAAEAPEAEAAEEPEAEAAEEPTAEAAEEPAAEAPEAEAAEAPEAEAAEEPAAEAAEEPAAEASEEAATDPDDGGTTEEEE
jgi:large subunit ribosomal protein L10